MNNTMDYKGYVGSIEFSEEDNMYYGKIMGVHAMISYRGENTCKLEDDFHAAVDHYLMHQTDRGLKEQYEMTDDEIMVGKFIKEYRSKKRNKSVCD